MSDGRRKRGSAIAEFGPALFILLLCLFFPLLDMVALGLHYVACAQLVSLQTQKAAQVTRADAVNASGPVRGGLPDAWMKTGMGQFVRLAQRPNTEVKYDKIDDREENVIVSTTFQVPPLLMIPVCPGVPGLGAPSTFVISSKRLMEDPEHQ